MIKVVWKGADRETRERMENMCVYVCIKETEREREENKKEEGVGRGEMGRGRKRGRRTGSRGRREREGKGGGEGRRGEVRWGREEGRESSPCYPHCTD